METHQGAGNPPSAQHASYQHHNTNGDMNSPTFSAQPASHQVASPQPNNMAVAPQSRVPHLSDSRRDSNAATPNFASPEQQAATHDLKSNSGYSNLAANIKSTDPSIVRQVLRDHWDKCFLGSEYHMAFVLNATVHEASAATIGRAVQDFGAKLVETSKNQFLGHFTAKDYDAVAELVLSRVSPQFLDKALAQRLETIGARDLVNALAKAERLGYDVQDIVESNTSDGTESVIPSLTGMQHLLNPSDASPAQHQQHYPQQQPQQAGGWYNQQQPLPQPPPHQLPQAQAALPTRLPETPVKGPAGIHYCQKCSRPCTGKFALSYHTNKDACDPFFKIDKVGKNICLHCGCTFGSATGVLYHMKSKVCGDYSEEATGVCWNELKQYAERVRQQAAQTGGFQQQQRPPNQPPPGVKQKAMISPGPTSVSGADPYAHLSLESRQKLQAEIAEAEQKYGRLLRQAMYSDAPDADRIERMGKLKNSYNTKLSTTRKRYGARLREKRTAEDIAAERKRMLQRDDGDEIWLEQERAFARLKQHGHATLAHPKPPQSSARGTPNRSTQPAPPRPRVPLSEMGGLHGSAGSAETMDPTANLTSSQPRAMPQMQYNQAAPGSGPGEPMAIDDDSESSQDHGKQVVAAGESESSDESSSDDDDDGIPA